MDQPLWDHVQGEEKWLRDRLAELGRVKKELLKSEAGLALADGGSTSRPAATDNQFGAVVDDLHA